MVKNWAMRSKSKRPYNDHLSPSPYKTEQLAAGLQSLVAAHNRLMLRINQNQKHFLNIFQM